jgi:hypothetical protein
MRLHASLIAALLLGGCTTDPKTDAGKTTADAKAPTEPELGPDGKPLGRVVASQYIDLRQLANKTVAEVEDVLGEPTTTGTDRVSCVRFVPERVFFACEQQIRVYQRPPFEQVRVEFEDGRAANIGITGLPGEGAFNLDAALASVGVLLPEAPSHSNPALGIGGDPGDVVDLWEWSNASARLRVDGLEHRVRVSVVNSEYRRAKLEIINNNPLSSEQAARIKPVKGETASSVSEPAN